jgi:hypothetical protein
VAERTLFPPEVANDPPVAVKDTLVEVSTYSEREPPLNIVAVCAVPVVPLWASRPSDLALVPVAAVKVAESVIPTPVVLFCVATYKPDPATPLEKNKLVSPAAADAVGADIKDINPANRAVVAVSAMRLRIVVFDIFFLSLVRVRNFLKLARRSCGSSNSV